MDGELSLALSLSLSPLSLLSLSLSLSLLSLSLSLSLSSLSLSLSLHLYSRVGKFHSFRPPSPPPLAFPHETQRTQRAQQPLLLTDPWGEGCVRARVRVCVCVCVCASPILFTSIPTVCIVKPTWALNYQSHMHKMKQQTLCIWVLLCYSTLFCKKRECLDFGHEKERLRGKKRKWRRWTFGALLFP